MKSPIILIFVLALTWPLSVRAQMDSVQTRKGAAPVIVQAFKHNALEVERQFPDGRKLLSIPYSDLEYVRFADGVEIRFQDGEMVRDNLLYAPKFYSRLWTVKVEEVIDLTQSEIRQLYGDELYITEYRPNRARLITGLGKIAGGFVGFLAAACADPTRWGSKHRDYYQGAYNSYPGERIVEDYNYGNLNIGWISVECLLLGTYLTGHVDQVSSVMRLKALARQRQEMPAPTMKKAKAEIWGGTALMAAGAGTMCYFASQLNEHREWDHRFRSRDGVVEENIHRGEPASGWDVFGLFVGAVAVDLGLSTFHMGQRRLSSLRKFDRMPYAMQVDLGPAPSGYGLTVRF